MARTPALEPDQRRAQLLQTARAVFSLRGYHATSVSDIQEAAGVARGTFYNYFPSKREIFQAVLAAMMEELAVAFRPLQVDRPLGPQLEENLARLVEVADRSEVARLLFSDAVGLDQEGDAALRGFYGQLLGRLERSLTLGQALGIVRAGDPAVMARVLLGTLKEPVFLAWLEGRPLAREALVTEMIALLTGGVVHLPSTAR